MLRLHALPWAWRRTGALLAGTTGWLRSEVAHTIAFLLLLTVATMVLELPWGLYGTFVVEARHGFNKQTLGLYFSDLAKQVGCRWTLQRSCSARAQQHAAASTPC